MMAHPNNCHRRFLPRWRPSAEHSLRGSGRGGAEKILKKRRAVAIEACLIVQILLLSILILCQPAGAWICSTERNPVVTLAYDPATAKYQVVGTSGADGSAGGASESSSGGNGGTGGRRTLSLRVRGRREEREGGASSYGILGGSDHDEDGTGKATGDDIPRRRELDFSKAVPAIPVSAAAAPRSAEDGAASSSRSSSSRMMLDDERDGVEDDPAGAPPTTIQVRRCTCITERTSPLDWQFCEVGLDYCYVEREWFVTGTAASAGPICVNRSEKIAAARTVWPLIVVWFAVLFACLFFTRTGRNAVDYALTCVLPKCWNDFVVRTMERRDPDRARMLVRRFYTRNRDNAEVRFQQLLIGSGADRDRRRNRNNANGDDRQPSTELHLKTRIYKRQHQREETTSQSSRNNGATNFRGRNKKTPPEELDDDEDRNTGNAHLDNEDLSEEAGGGAGATAPGSENNLDGAVVAAVSVDDDEDDAACSICYVELEDGDRIGALPCKHTFHVDCLKTWLPHRNVCPLCLEPDVATASTHPSAEPAAKD